MDKHKKGVILGVIATFFFATSPILFRISSKSLSPYEVTFGRMFIGSVFIFLAATYSKESIMINFKDIRKFLFYGLIAALHFLLYNLALYYTTIAHALSIVYLSPIFVAILSGVFLKEPLPRYKFIGIGLVVVSIGYMVGFEPYTTKEMLLGDGLALLSAICYTIYSLAGRAERKNYSLLQYTFWVYLISALFLLPTAIHGFTGNYSGMSLITLLLLGLLPTTLGHTLYNSAIRHTHPAYINLISTQEITGGVIFGIFILGEIPSTSTIIGILVMLVGLTIVLINKTIFGNNKKEGILHHYVE
jgi:drug/metabolite transporter (DMT)-like permease